MPFGGCGKAMCDINMAWFRNIKLAKWCRYVVVFAIWAGVAPSQMLNINAAFYTKRQDEKTTTYPITADNAAYFGHRGQRKPAVNCGNDER